MVPRLDGLGQVCFAEQGKHVALHRAQHRAERQGVRLEAERVLELVAQRFQAEERIAKPLLISWPAKATNYFVEVLVKKPKNWSRMLLVFCWSHRGVYAAYLP